MGFLRRARGGRIPGVGHRQIPRRGELGGEADQAERDHVREPLALLVLGGRRRGDVLELVVPSGKSLEADELEGVFGAAATGILGRHQHVDLGHLPVAHVVDEGDLLPEEFAIAEAAIDEDPEGVHGRGARAGDCVAGAGRA